MNADAAAGMPWASAFRFEFGLHMKKSLRAGMLAAAMTSSLGFGSAASAEGKNTGVDMGELRDLILQQREALDRQEKALEIQRVQLEALEA
jgi:hypothetical protein